MRIDFVITELNVGGAEKALSELAIGMQSRHHDVRVLSIGSEPSSNRHRLVDRLADENVHVQFGGFDHWSRLFSATRWLSRTMRDDRPDVCQTFLFHANCLGTIAAKRAGVRPIVGGLRVAETNRLRCSVEKRLIDQVDHLVCVSRQVQTFATGRLSVNPQACAVIPNGVDVATYRDADAFDWSSLGWPPASNVALFIGRLHPQKGLELIQQQFSQMFEHDPERRLLLIGSGPLEQSLSLWANQIGEDRVRLLPFQSDVAPFIRAASMLILPSHYEGMPNVVLESMAAGRPVVCSRVEGSEELLGDGDRSRRQGFPPGDGPAMSRLTDALFRDRSLRRQIGQANQKYVEQHFSNRQMIDRYESLYKSLLAR